MIGRLLAGAFALWRVTLGAVIRDSCRFTPSCSHYAADAVLQKGVVRGLAIASWRILRCQPLCKGGYDPVIRSAPPCSPHR
ncbi:MAG: putative membrane protein insertion efficiency factor [Pseudohongiellaceae bacterium]|jgi:putative membrane protein insertion efficiency factor